MTLSTPFENNPKTTATYEEVIAFYQSLAAQFPQKMQLTAQGSTDAGLPIHTAIISSDGDFDAVSIRRKNKRILLINNGIHPGEPEGIDATMMMLRNYLTQPELQKWLEKTVIVAIPVYNIDGCLNRNSDSRSNQDGPESYGFRGNARNLDLNRDFVKCDSRNAQTFNQILQYWQPEIFVDNHTSNGADYQYTMTLIPTQHNKLQKELGDYLQKKLIPRLYSDMKIRGWEMIPYVNHEAETPDSGIYGFLDHPRYSTGYAALHNVIGFMPETHMLKPFADRVRSTYAFMESVLHAVHDDAQAIGEAKKRADLAVTKQQQFVLNWAVDEKAVEQLPFKGFEAKHKPSEVSGLPRLWYDRSAPFERPIPFWNTYLPALTVEKPEAYIFPQAYADVAERLRWNGAVVSELAADASVEVEVYKIKDFKTSKEAYEGHYLHSQVQIEKRTEQKKYRKGDFLVRTNQVANAYIVQTLEPQAPDSYFAWNFFDGILMQKEGFSAYVFEDLAAEFLSQNPTIRKELEAKKAIEPDFAKSAEAQLDWVYRRTPHYEPTHRVYPVGRVLKNESGLIVK